MTGCRPKFGPERVIIDSDNDERWEHMTVSRETADRPVTTTLRVIFGVCVLTGLTGLVLVTIGGYKIYTGTDSDLLPVQPNTSAGVLIVLGGLCWALARLIWKWLEHRLDVPEEARL